MLRSTVPIALILIVVGGLLAIALPELYGLITGLQERPTGVSPLLSELAGRVPLILFLVVGVTFTAVATAVYRR